MKTLQPGFESLVALVLAGLVFVVLGAALNVLCRLFLAGWHAADFLLQLFLSYT